MTVNYALDVSSSSLTGFFRLLFRWRGSVWKSIWQELLGWLCCYYLISIVYRFALDDAAKESFKVIAKYCDEYATSIPLAFVLSFYVNQVVSRWSYMFGNIGFIDNAALIIAMHIPGDDERRRILRRIIIRYMVLNQALSYRTISVAVNKRFPTIDTLVAAGLMNADEKRIFDHVGVTNMTNVRHFVPIQWIMMLIKRARNDGDIENDGHMSAITERVREFFNANEFLKRYDWISLPIAYSQVVFIAVRVYFFVALMGRKWLDESSGQDFINLYFPFTTVMQFIVYVGWIRVAQALLNPFGMDDDDFEMNYVIDRNLEQGFKIVDNAAGELPTMQRDEFWSDTNPVPLYTKETAAMPVSRMVGSATNIKPPENDIIMMKRNDASNPSMLSPTSSGANIDNQQQQQQSQISSTDSTSTTHGSISIGKKRLSLTAVAGRKMSQISLKRMFSRNKQHNAVGAKRSSNTPKIIVLENNGNSCKLDYAAANNVVQPTETYPSVPIVDDGNKNSHDEIHLNIENLPIYDDDDMATNSTSGYFVHRLAIVEEEETPAAATSSFATITVEPEKQKPAI